MVQVVAALLFWVAVGLIQKLNWGLGGWKALVLLACLAAVPFLWRAGRAAGIARATPRALVIAACAILVLQTGYALKELRHPSLIDAATTTLAAGTTLRSGVDPYAASLDSSAAALTHEPRFAGYKYLPVTLATYLPLGAPFGERGVVLTNLLLHLATLWLIFELTQAMAGPGAAWLALLLYLSLPLVPFQLFAKGVTDPPAVLPMLAALLLAERSALLTGLALGLSISAKLVPGALLLPCCLPRGGRARLAYGAGLAMGLLPILPFALWAPGAFADNILLFNLARPPDSTSWLYAAPPLFAALAHGAVLLLYLAAWLAAWRRPLALLERSAAAVILILAAILAGPAAHHNYQLWWLPLMAALLGVAFVPRDLPSAAPPVYHSGDRST